MAQGLELGGTEEVLPRQGAAAAGGHHALTSRLLADPTARIGLVVLGVLVLAAVFAPVLAPADPATQDVMNRFAGPGRDHPLGTDALGRDVLSRLLFGARISLLTSVALGLVVLFIGVVVGTVSGFAGGWIDGAIMRAVDVLLAFPNFLLVLVVVGALGPGLVNLAIAFALAGWVGYARVVRGLVIAAKERPHVEAGRALGLSAWRVATRHLLPGVLAPVMVLWTLQMGRLLLALAALSFLGLGVQPPTPEWGAMLNDARDSLARAPQLMLYPGILITVAALGFNLLGDGLRDVLDPTLR